jgi:hypothetical protein
VIRERLVWLEELDDFRAPAIGRGAVVRQARLDDRSDACRA